jgi:hypothetical protein
MFQQQTQPTPEPIETKNDEEKLKYKYKTYFNSQTTSEETTTHSLIKIDELLETEKKNMNSEPWNKLDKRLKIQKLHAYAEKYGKENNFSMKSIKDLKTFFSDCLLKDKLSKVKDVVYNKETGVIGSIPGLVFNPTSKAFTLRNLDKKVSTLKSLTPKKMSDTDAVEDTVVEDTVVEASTVEASTVEDTAVDSETSTPI